MAKHVRRRVVKFVLSPNTSPDEIWRKLFPQVSTAVLECGHSLELGIQVDYRPATMACYLCGPTVRRWGKARR